MLLNRAAVSSSRHERTLRLSGRSGKRISGPYRCPPASGEIQAYNRDLRHHSHHRKRGHGPVEGAEGVQVADDAKG